MILNYTKSFIEEQFPEELLGYECLKERKSAASQTLPKLGKWWGRKPLILVRATILGLLMPASDNPTKDMDIFLKILTMDDDGLWLRNKNKKKFTREEFDSMSYNDKLTYCIRPEHVENLPADSWLVINKHLKTNASNLQELINELGQKKFGHTPKVGDVFCGGGSIPFEAARIGCETHASDLNPVATMLTWANLNILGCTDEEKEQLMTFQDIVFDTVTKEIDALKIEQRPNGDVAKFYLYCNETICPDCGWKVPLLPSYIISKKTNTVVELIENPNLKSYDFKLNEDLTSSELKELELKATVQSSTLVCPHCSKKTSINSIRGGEGSPKLRKWSKKDWKPLHDDVFTERLYAIQYIRFDNTPNSDKYNVIRKNIGNCKAVIDSLRDWHIYYKIPDEHDLKNETIVEKYLEEHFDEWQEKGYIPSQYMEEGVESGKPRRMSGFSYWHQLFNPRQLLFLGLLNKAVANLASNSKEFILGSLMLNRCCDWNSKLCVWNSHISVGQQTFMNQALNSLYNWSCRSSYSLYSASKIELYSNCSNVSSKNIINLKDAKDVNDVCDLWITDPPYADAINYHELTEFFLAWDKKMIPKIFPEWYADSKRELAVRGADQSFIDSMIDVYSNLTNHMNDSGYQVIMFNHSSEAVLDGLETILNKSGLDIVRKYSVDVETKSGGLKKNGKYYSDAKLYICKKQA